MTGQQSVVSLRWPLAGAGDLVLTLFTDAPSADAIRLLGPVVEAIEAYQSAVAFAELLHPQRPSSDERAAAS